MRKRYKLLLIIFISFLLVLFIYFVFRKEKFIYVNLGDSLSYNKFTTYDFTDYLKYYYRDKNVTFYEYAEEYNPSQDLYKQIIENTANINYYLKNATLITISLGTIELYNYKELNEEVVINYLNNLFILLNKLGKLNKRIFLINVYDDSYMLINKKLKEYCQLNKIYYIDKEDINETDIYVSNLKTYLNYQGHKKIADLIVKEMKTEK